MRINIEPVREIGTHRVPPFLAVKAKSLDQPSPIGWIEFPERLYEIEDGEGLLLQPLDSLLDLPLFKEGFTPQITELLRG